MPIRQIKPKPIVPPIEYSKRLATEAEKEEAQRCSKRSPLGRSGNLIGLLAFCLFGTIGDFLSDRQLGVVLGIVAAIATRYLVSVIIETSVFDSN